MLKALNLSLSLLCVLGLAGCALPGSTQPVLKVGLVAPFEGWYRPRGYDALSAVRLAIQEAQAAGGVAGWQVELVALDDHLDPAWAPQRARELTLDPAVMGVVGGLSAEVVEAARGVYADAGLALVTPSSVVARGDGVYVAAPALGALADAVAAHIAQEGGGKVVLLQEGEDNPWAVALRKSMSLTSAVMIGRQEWTEDLADAGPSWVVCTAGARVCAEALQRIRPEGLRAVLVGDPDWGTEALLRLAPEAAGEALFVSGVPRREDLDAAFVRAYSELAGHEPGPDAVLAYDATRALLDALAQAIEADGQPTRQGVRTALARVALQGVSGPLEFHQQGARRAAAVWVRRVR